MKKRIIILLSASTVLLAGCGVKDKEVAQVADFGQEVQQENETEQTAESKSEKEEVQVEITSEHFEGASDESRKDVKYTYEYDKPVVAISGNTSAQDKVQADLDEYVDTFLDNLTKNEFGYVYEDMEPDAEPSYQILSMNVIRADSDVISICMTTEGYDHGAHGWMTVDYFNYFTATGDKVTFAQLGDGFREMAEKLVFVKVSLMQEEEPVFFYNYQDSIPFVVMDGTEDADEVYQRVYGEDFTWSDTSERQPMFSKFYITDTGFGFTSGQYVLQPYAAGVIDFEFSAADFGETYTSDIFNSPEAMEKTMDEETLRYVEGPITEEEYNTFTKTTEPVDASGFDDFSKTMQQDFYGTWYDPVAGDAIRLTSVGAYVYIPYLDMQGDQLYKWEMIDRSEKGLCPELAVYYDGADTPPLAYYIAGYRDGYFWCNAQEQIFYKQ